MNHILPNFLIHLVNVAAVLISPYFKPFCLTGDQQSLQQTELRGIQAVY